MVNLRNKKIYCKQRRVMSDDPTQVYIKNKR